MGNKETNFPKKLDMLKSIGLKKAIDELMVKESNFIPVADVCKAYLRKLSRGYHEEELIESFIPALAKVAVNESAKDTVSKVNAIYECRKRDIETVKTLYEMERGSYNYIVPMIESAVVEYVTDKSSATREKARQSLNLFEGIPGLSTIFENLSFDEYEEKTGKKLLNMSIDESFLQEETKTYTQEELDRIVKEEKKKAVLESEQSKVSAVQNIDMYDTHIDLSKTISNILKKEPKNESLRAFCEQYITALNRGKKDELLYESFISGVSNWNYLNAVDTELSALSDRISKYQQDIDLKKILETMKETGSYYIVPLIEGVVIDYMNNKSMQNKAILKQRLSAFEYDPFVRDIINIVQHDLSIASTVYLGESIELLNNRVHTENIYSPVLYIKENECVFNVKGIYYDRKGNTISKMTKSAVESLDESFHRLCDILNSDAVEINEAEDCIKVYDDNYKAVITDSRITLNGDPVNEDELANLASTSRLMNEHKERFFNAVKLINENYNKIAYIDFVKRVALNESDDRTVDVFRVKDNLFVTTCDRALGKTVFYRNINPIQCRTYINEHMQINAAKLFEDILPDQESIQKDIDDTKKQYEDYIADLESKKQKLVDMKDSADADTVKDIDSAISLIDEELADIKDNYKTYQKQSDEFTGEIPADDTETDNIADPESPAADDDNTAGTSAEDIQDTAGEETEPEMSVPVTETQPEPEATPYDGLLDAPADPDSAYEVVKVSYRENVKTGKKSGSGEVYLMIPSVDSNGDVHNELKTVTFYLDPDRNPVINNEYMPLALYNVIRDAIVQAPDTQSVELTPEEAENPPAAPAGDNADALSEIPAGEETEDMFGVEDDPETLDTLAALTDDIPAEDTALDSSMDAGPEDSSGVAFTKPELSDDDLAALDSLDFETPVNNAGTETSAADSASAETSAPVQQETPAEVEEKEPKYDYPISLGLDFQDIAPIKKERFMESMSKMGISCSTPEGYGNNACCITVGNKADAYALRDYFKEWKNFSDQQFENFFPELKQCFENNPKVPVAPANESVKILGVQKVNESAIIGSNNRTGSVSVSVPDIEKYASLAQYGKRNAKTRKIDVVTESYDESRDVYNILKAINESSKGKVTGAVKDFLDRYAIDFDRVSEAVSVVSVPYSNLLESKLINSGIVVTVSENSIDISADSTNIKKVKKILESYYKAKVSDNISGIFDRISSGLNEGIKITIRDDKTGKTIELDTDNLDNVKKQDDGQAAADSVSDEYTTFEAEDSQLFGGSTTDDSDDEKEEDKEKEEDVEKDSSKEGDEDKDTEEEPKKKLKFKVKKKAKKTDESVKPANAVPLNESAGIAEPNVFDWVRYGNNLTGQIIAKQADGNFIVSAYGSTVICSPDSVKPVTPRPDTVDAPYKYDKNTLKGLFEQMVQAGMYMNNNRITPSDCYVKYSEFMNAKDEDDVRLVVEGETLYANKKYIRVLEDVNDFANPADYIDGSEISSQGDVLRSVKINKKDYETAVGASSPVRVLVGCDTDQCKLIQLPKGSLLLQSID